MRHILFEESPTNEYAVAILIKPSAFNKKELQNNYVDPLVYGGIQTNNIIAFTLHYEDTGKVSAASMKEYLAKLLTALKSLGTNLLYVADAGYFKTLTGQTKAEPHFGYVMPCKLKGFQEFKVVLGINHQALIYNPELNSKLMMGLNAVASYSSGTYVDPGNGIIHSGYYPESIEDIAAALEKLHQYPELTCDIEAFSLRFNEAGIGTISFAWDKHNGIAFACDYRPIRCQKDIDESPDRLGRGHGFYQKNAAVRALLLRFFSSYKGEITWHNSPYDLKVIIYSLWMDTLLDTKGMLKGLEIMTRSFQDTKIIAYLATNSTSGNVLGLKKLAHEYAGNWAVEVKDISLVPLDELLQYNLVDCLSTWYVKEKYTPIMIADKQQDIYINMMLPSLVTIIQMELTGLPLYAKKVQEVKQQLQIIQEMHTTLIKGSPVIKLLSLVVQTDAMTAANAKLKVKQHPLEKFSHIEFNPNSSVQLQKLLYNQMGLPILDYTDTKQPATGADTIGKLINHTENQEYKKLLSSLIAHGEVSKILTTFIPAFEKAILKDDGMTWLHGSFNLGGTVSGRLSSSEPNLQNLPAGNTGSDAKQLYGKLIKSCVTAPDGWLFCGADFNSLEDRINTLLTKDPQKLKVYTDGYDSHSLRAQAYFPQHMDDIRVIDESENLRTFKIVIDGQTHLLIEGDSVKLPNGTTVKVENLCL